MMTEIHCTNCHSLYPEQGVPFRCPQCGGVYDFCKPLTYRSSEIDNSNPGLWRYRDSFGLPEQAPEITLGEGNTPLIWREIFGRKVAFKLEYMNPTGSFKDRGTALLISFLRSRDIHKAVEDSSGNAGASFAAYAARAGMQACVYIPAYASGPKRAQIEAYGAQVISVEGARSEATEAVLAATESGAVYASHAYLPFGLPGMATTAFEIYEQIGGAPGAVISPVGQGSLLLGVGRGFEAIYEASFIDSFPTLIGVQALACAPMWAVFMYGSSGLGWVSEGETLAEGIRIKHPLRGDTILQLIKKRGGQFMAVDEEDILPGRDQLARLGFFVEPTSAIVWKALEQLIDELPDPVVVLLSGSGYKAP